MRSPADSHPPATCLFSSPYPKSFVCLGLLVRGYDQEAVVLNDWRHAADDAARRDRPQPVSFRFSSTKRPIRVFRQPVDFHVNSVYHLVVFL